MSQQRDESAGSNALWMASDAPAQPRRFVLRRPGPAVWGAVWVVLGLAVGVLAVAWSPWIALPGLALIVVGVRGLLSRVVVADGHVLVHGWLRTLDVATAEVDRVALGLGRRRPRWEPLLLIGGGDAHWLSALASRRRRAGSRLDHQLTALAGAIGVPRDAPGTPLAPPAGSRPTVMRSPWRIARGVATAVAGSVLCAALVVGLFSIGDLGGSLATLARVVGTVMVVVLPVSPLFGVADALARVRVARGLIGTTTYVIPVAGAQPADTAEPESTLRRRNAPPPTLPCEDVADIRLRRSPRGWYTPVLRRSQGDEVSLRELVGRGRSVMPDGRLDRQLALLLVATGARYLGVEGAPGFVLPPVPLRPVPAEEPAPAPVARDAARAGAATAHLDRLLGELHAELTRARFDTSPLTEATPHSSAFFLVRRPDRAYAISHRDGRVTVDLGRGRVAELEPSDPASLARAVAHAVARPAPPAEVDPYVR